MKIFSNKTKTVGLLLVSCMILYAGCIEVETERSQSTWGVTGISLNYTTLSLPIGANAQLTATVSPSNAANPNVTWSSSNPSVATVSNNGLVTALAVGNATITATTEQNNKTASCNVTVKEGIFSDDINGVVINGVRWATRNVDAPGVFASKPESLGMFYQWNRKVGWSATDPIINSNGGTTWDPSTSTGTTWEKANDPSPSGWRVPTNDEIGRLIDFEKVTYQWTTKNGVLGERFSDKTNGNAIFLPAGWRGFGGELNVGSEGHYWSNKQSNGSYAFNMVFNDNGAFGLSENSNSLGFLIRPVAE